MERPSLDRSWDTILQRAYFSCEVSCTHCFHFIIFHSSFQSGFPWLWCCITPISTNRFYSMWMAPSGILPHCGPVASPPNRPSEQFFLRSSVIYYLRETFLVFSSYNFLAAFYSNGYSCLVVMSFCFLDTLVFFSFFFVSTARSFSTCH